MINHCQHCGKQIHDPKHPLRSYCDRMCMGAAHVTRVVKACAQCGSEFEVKLSHSGHIVCCSRKCSSLHRRGKPRAMRVPTRTCRRCGTEFARHPGDKRTYCSRQCRYTGRRQMPDEIRARLSAQRLGSANPNWKGGGPNTGLYRMHSKAARWAQVHLGSSCDRCGVEGAELHHVVPKRAFRSSIAAHFRQNMVMLCTPCHRGIDRQARAAVREGQPQDYPYGSRLPESILRQIVRGGSVLTLDRQCDYSPIGSVARLVLPSDWFDATAA